jgi:hypothetical protein
MPGSQIEFAAIPEATDVASKEVSPEEAWYHSAIYALCAQNSKVVDRNRNAHC